MKLTEYQTTARDYAIYPKQYEIIYPSMGLVGEAGEVAEKIKKLLRRNTLIPMGVDSYTRIEIAKELGDVLWYVACLADDLGFTLEEVAQMNIDKLADRASRNVIEGNGDNR
jgi:NTP pyrophosphatase (non-canonical NTP hydrolase)